MPAISSLLTDSDAEWFARNGVRRDLRPGEAIAVEGSQNIWLIIILGGEFLVTLDAAGVIARLGPGEFVGEMSLIDGNPASATVAANGAARALFLDRWAVERKIRTDTGFAARFYRAVALFQTGRLRDTNQQLTADRAPGYAAAQAKSNDVDDNLQRMLLILNDS